MALNAAAKNRAHSPTRRRLNDYSHGSDAEEAICREFQQAKSPFTVGDTNGIAQRIYDLQTDLKHFDAAPVNSGDTAYHPSVGNVAGVECSRYRDFPLTKEFRHNYKLRIRSSKTPRPRAHNIGLQNDMSKSISSDQPKFVDMYEFGGMKEVMPLPFGLTGEYLAERVVKAQPKILKKVTYASYLRGILKSASMVSVIENSFWYIFLDKFQRDRNEENMNTLFKRVVNEYMKAITPLQHCSAKDAFLNSFPEILAQLVYSGFCCSFPDSFNKFDGFFTTHILFTTYSWFSGARPSPHVWKDWDFKELEPPGIRARAEAAANASKSKETNLFNMDWVKALEPSDSTPLDRKAAKQAEVQDNTAGTTIKTRDETLSFEVPQRGTECVIFNTRGNALAMQQYAKERNKSLRPGPNYLLSHRQLAPTYQPEDITALPFVRDSYKALRRNLQGARLQMDGYQRAKTRCHRETMEAMRHHERAETQLLRHPSEIKAISFLLMETSQMDGAEGALHEGDRDNAVSTALQRYAKVPLS